MKTLLLSLMREPFRSHMSYGCLQPCNGIVSLVSSAGPQVFIFAKAGLSQIQTRVQKTYCKTSERLYFWALPETVEVTLSGGACRWRSQRAKYDNIAGAERRPS